VQENGKRLVLVGASNLKATVSLLKEEEFEVIDLTVQGRTVNQEDMVELLMKLKTMTLGSNMTFMAFVCDLFRNSCTRVTLFDRTTTPPVAGITCLPKFVSVKVASLPSW
jgi:hypothetical protein